MEGWRGEITLPSSSYTWKLLSPFISFLICHWPQQQQKGSSGRVGEGKEMCVKKNTLLTSVGSLCFLSIFHPILMTKWVLSNVCYQFDPKHTFIHFPHAPFFSSNRLYLSKERRRWCRHTADAGNYQWTESHSSLLPIYATMLHKGIQCEEGNKDNSYFECQIVFFKTRLTKYYLFRSRG